MQSEDTMNVLIENVVRTAKDGSKTSLEQVYIRGSQIRYFIVPDMLKHAPMFKNLLKQKQAPTTGGPAKGTAFGTLSSGAPQYPFGGKGGGRR
jgi:small nuclear ribonucleoprotein D3